VRFRRYWVNGTERKFTDNICALDRGIESILFGIKIVGSKIREINKSRTIPRRYKETVSFVVNNHSL